MVATSLGAQAVFVDFETLKLFKHLGPNHRFLDWIVVINNPDHH